MDILVSSNFERLLWFLAYQTRDGASIGEKRKYAGEKVRGWLNELKSNGGFGVEPVILQAARSDFESERISNKETVETIKRFYTASIPSSVNGGTHSHHSEDATVQEQGYILDPHSAIGVAASLHSIARARPPVMHHIALATAHPAKFANAVHLALHDEKGFSFDAILPEQFVGLEKKERRVRAVPREAGLEGMKKIIRDEVTKEIEVQ